MKHRELYLKEISLQLQSWLDFNEIRDELEGHETKDSDNIMSPPVWPSRSVLKNWISVLNNDEEDIGIKKETSNGLPKEFCDLITEFTKRK